MHLEFNRHILKRSGHYHFLLFRNVENLSGKPRIASVSGMRHLIDADVIGCSSDEGAYQPRFAIECNFYCAAQQR